jgi:hypothetical protein
MHKRGEKPQIVNNKSELNEFKNKGWRNRYIWTEFPKAVNGIIVNSKEEEDLLKKANDAAPKVIVDKKTLSAGNTVIADTGKTAPILTEAPLKGSVQVADLEAAKKDLEQKVEMLEKQEEERLVKEKAEQEKKDDEEFERLEEEERLEKEAGTNLDKGFEMLGTDGEPIDGLHYDTWPEAQAAQKDLNANAPGHKARKIEG